MNLTGQPIYTGKRDGSEKDPERLAAVAALPCVICCEWSLPQLSPTTVHHVIHGRGSMGRKSPDRMTIPLCDGHHQGTFDRSKVALHREPQAWRDAYGNDRDWIDWTDDRINKGETP